MENQQNFVYSILSVPYLKTEYLQISRNRGLLPPEVLPTSCWELLLWRHGEAGKTQRSRGEQDTSVQTSAFLESNIRSQNTRPHWTFAVPSPECGLAASEKQWGELPFKRGVPWSQCAKRKRRWERRHWGPSRNKREVRHPTSPLGLPPHRHHYHREATWEGGTCNPWALFRNEQNKQKQASS